MLQSLADPVADVPSTAASAGRCPQDSPWDVSDIHCPCRSSAESEPQISHHIVHHISHPFLSPMAYTIHPILPHAVNQFQPRSIHFFELLHLSY